MMWLLVAALLAQTGDFEADGVKALDAKQYDAAVGLFTKAVAAEGKNAFVRRTGCMGLCAGSAGPG